jgi:hypothetical protein
MLRSPVHLLNRLGLACCQPVIVPQHNCFCANANHADSLCPLLPVGLLRLLLCLHCYCHIALAATAAAVTMSVQCCSSRTDMAAVAATINHHHHHQCRCDKEHCLSLTALSQCCAALLTLISFVMDLMRLRDSSDSRIMPSMPLYSSSET